MVETCTLCKSKGEIETINLIFRIKMKVEQTMRQDHSKNFFS